MKNLLRIFALSLAIWTIQAASYYIDATGGSDANNGTSTNTPWQHCPGMRSFTGTYSKNASGDNFYFKGGETWGTTNFCLKIQSGSSSSETPMYYGVTSNWFTGESWSMPVFDGENCVVSNNLGVSQQTYNAALVLIRATNTGAQCSNIKVEGINFKNFRGRLNDGTGTGMAMISVDCQGAKTLMTNIVISACRFQDWTLPSYGAYDDSGYWGGVYSVSDNGNDWSILDSEFWQSDFNQRSGSAIHHWNGTRASILRNVIHDVCNGIILCQASVRSNIFYNIASCKDPLAHENVLYNAGISTIAYNYFTNVFPPCVYDESGAFRTAASGLYDTNTGANITRIFNNVMDKNTGDPAIEIDLENLGSGTAEGVQRTGLRIYNNTIRSPGNYCIRVTSRTPEGDLGYLEYANNYFMTNSAACVSISQSSVVAPIVTFNNITNSTAQAESYSFLATNKFKPLSISQPLYQQGATLTTNAPYFFSLDFNGATRTPPVDVGAYEIDTQPIVPMTLRITILNVITVQ